MNAAVGAEAVLGGVYRRFEQGGLYLVDRFWRKVVAFGDLFKRVGGDQLIFAVHRNGDLVFVDDQPRRGRFGGEKLL